MLILLKIEFKNTLAFQFNNQFNGGSPPMLHGLSDKVATHRYFTLTRGLESMNESTLTERAQMLLNNDLTWYVVTLENGEYELIHESGLSNILQCGEPMSDYGYTAIERCWNGEMGCSDENDWT